jgi:hypothetical protein
MRVVRPFIVAAALALCTPSALAQRAEARSPSADPRVSLSPESNPRTEPITIVDGIAASVAATVIAVPTSIGLANAMTRLSPDLLGGGIPALLWLGFAPPFAAHGLAVLAMNLHEPGRYNLWPTIFATLPVHWGALAVGALSGVWYGNPANLALFTLVESVLLPSVAVTLSWVTRRPPRRASARRAPRAPMAMVAADRAPLVRAALDMRASAPQATATGALLVPVFSGSF